MKNSTGIPSRAASPRPSVLLRRLSRVVPAQATDYDVGSMHISQTWSRATPKGAAAGAGYMTITNKGTAPDRVSCVADDASAQCQIHSMTMDDGVMKMRPVEGGLEIKPGETVALKPGSFHIMFLDLKHPLEQGQSVKATLKFDTCRLRQCRISDHGDRRAGAGRRCRRHMNDAGRQDDDAGRLDADGAQAVAV